MITEGTFQPGAVSYDAMAPNYAAARALTPATADLWAGVIESILPRTRPATLLDLGCGTGRFASLIAERFDVHVVGFDASVGMLQVAASQRQLINLNYGVGRAESVPLANASCDVVWMSQMIHHVEDREACAREVRRVVRPTGTVAIRGGFGDRLDSFPTIFRFFPGARRIGEQITSLREIIALFREAGFYVVSFRSIPQQTCANLREFAERTRGRADSTLALLSDVEFERCQAALEKAAAEEKTPQPIIETIDLLVLKPHAEPKG